MVSWFKTHHSVTWRLIVRILLFSGLVTIIATSAQLYIDYREDIQEIHEGFAEIERNFLQALATAYWFMDDNFMRIQLEGMLQTRDIQYLEVRTHGVPYMSAGTPQSEKVIEREYPLVYHPGNEPVQLGTLSVVAGLDGVYRRLWDNLWVILISQAAKTFLVVLFMFLVFQYIVADRLKTIAAYVSGLRLEDPDPPEPLTRQESAHGNDELERVTEAINRMISRLYGAYDRVKTELEGRREAEEALLEINRDLENRVAERAREILNTNRALKLEIQERKLAEKRLHRYQKIVSFSRDMIALVDEDFRIRSVNEECARMFDETETAMAGRPVSSLFPADQFVNAIKPALQRCIGGEIVRDEIWFSRTGGEQRCMDVAYYPYRDPEDLQHGVVVNARDITRSKHMEDYLQRTRLMEVVGRMAGGISHEFNNALSVITASLDMLRLTRPEDRALLEHVHHMRVSADRMANLAWQLLAYARGGKYNPETISLDGLMEEAIHLVRHQFPSDISFFIDEWASLSGIGDPAQIQMVFLEVLQNAAEAVSTEASRREIRIALSRIDVGDDLDKATPDARPGTYAGIRVEDGGMGMDESIRASLFDPFFSTKLQGRGLGMAAVYGIVRNHDGWIRVDSEIAVGTRVLIGLPLFETDSAYLQRPDPG